MCLKTVNILLFSIISGLIYGQTKLINFETDCLEGIYYSDELIFEDRIVEKSLSDDTLKIIVARIDDCIYEESNGKFKYDNDTLKLYYSQINHDSELPAITMCDCPFEFTYTIKGLTSVPKVIFVNDNFLIYKSDRFKTFDVKYEIFEGDTLNLVDKYGLRQKRWITLEEDTVDWRGKNEYVRFIHDFNYLNNELKYGSRIAYDKDYKIHSVLRFNKDGTKEAFLYNKEGQIINHEKFE